MIDSFFYIPGDKLKFLNKIPQINADYFVVDLEDSVAHTNKQLGYELVMDIRITENMFLRIPIEGKCYTDAQIENLVKKFKGKIVFPKFNSINLLRNFLLFFKNETPQLIILIETPKGFLVVEDILKEFSNYIYAISFGSHDFCSITGIKHSFKYLSFYKNQLLLLTKAYEVQFIDGVNLNLNNFKKFKKECLYAYNAGASGKFLIHPNQLNEFNSIKFISDDKINEIKRIYEFVKDIPNNSLDVYTIEGKIYERPHILRIKYLMNKLKKNNKL